MSLKKEVSYYFIGNTVSKAVSFFLVPIYVSSMSTAEYGIVGSMQALISVLALFLSLGVERSIYRLYHDYKTDFEKKCFLGSVYLFIIVFALLIIGILLLCKDPVSHIYKTIPFMPYYVLAFGVAYLGIFNCVPKIYLQVTEQAKKYMVLSLLEMFIGAACILYFTVFRKEAAYGMLKGLLMAPLCMAIYYIFFCIKNFTITHNFLKYIQPTLKYSIPLLPSLLSSWVISMSSQMFIEHNFSTSEVAVYSLSMRLIEVISIFSASITIAYNPVFYRIANNQSKDVAVNQLIPLQDNIIIALLFICSMVAIGSKDIVTLFFPEDYMRAIDMVAILSSGTIIYQLVGFLNLSFYQEKKTVAIMHINVLCAIATIILNSFLIPQYGMPGAGFTYLISALVMFVIEFIYAKRLFYIPFVWIHIFYVLIIAVSLYLINRYFLPVSPTYTAIKIIIAIIAIYGCYRLFIKKVR